MEHESTDARLRRNVSELLQELRVAQGGVQILFGFLLAVTFTRPYLDATDFQHTVHLITVGLTVISVALLTAPAAWHRVLFRQGKRDHILAISNRFALWGLGFLASAVSGTVLLLVDVVLGLTQAIIAAAVALTVFGTLWFAMPLRHHEPVAEKAAPKDTESVENGP